MSHALVMLSGGIDSAVALAWASKHYNELSALSLNYHLRPFRERLAVYRLLQRIPAKLLEVELPFLKEASDTKSKLPKATPEGYISNRNMIFYSIASYFAEIKGCESLVGGHHSQDQAAFPDASVGFFQRFEGLVNQALLTRKIRLELPLMNWNKEQILLKAKEWNVPLEHTWSCYWDKMSPCGECVSCQERAQAFRKVGMKDPLYS